MFRRLAIASLWFVAFLSLHELAWSVFGSPRVLGIVIGGMAAAFVYFDPARLFNADTKVPERSAARFTLAGESTTQRTGPRI